MDYLPVEKLNALFKHTTNSYKLYWFLAILEAVRPLPQSQNDKKRTISVDSLVRRMLQFAWYPVCYFRLSLGKTDQLFSVISKHFLERTDGDAEIIQRFQIDKIPYKDIRRFSRYVPYRLLSPWFDEELRGLPESEFNAKVIELAESFYHKKKRQPLYKFDEGAKNIIIHYQWIGYLQKFNTILRDYTLWHLQEYVKQKNPHVPNIQDKLFEPPKRNLARAREFWSLYAESRSSIISIYSKDPIQDNFSIDHFLPWTFVTHDLIWNTIPVEKSINSQKSDKLPKLSLYLPAFTEQHIEAIRCMREKGKDSLLEDYNLFFDVDNDSLERLTRDPKRFHGEFSKRIKPLYTIASNMGFPSNWKYTRQGLPRE